MRGKQYLTGSINKWDRFIPAHAGKTTKQPTEREAIWVHPRACGENGSPFRAPPCLLWFIPAHAGKTSSAWNPVDGCMVHPRACGENGRFSIFRDEAKGSSPRMRGKRVLTTWPSAGVAVHPRACGENNNHSVIVESAAGSSPRMRGKPKRLWMNSWMRRFIPAHAGKTRTFANIGKTPGVHPRACGENCGARVGDHAPLGSSPRMRGKRRVHRQSGRQVGFIPAHAGKTRTVRD